MKRENRRTGRPERGSAMILALALALALSGCGIFGGSEAGVKVDFGPYSGTETAQEPGAGAETSEADDGGSQGEADETDQNGPDEGGETESRLEQKPSDNGAEKGTQEAQGGGDESRPVGADESQSGAGSEVSAGTRTPEERMKEFSGSKFAAEVEEYLKASGRGEEAFSEPIFDSATRVYTQEELSELSDVMCRVFRNEIYARYGVIFGNEDLNRLYRGFSWYKETIKLRDFEAQEELPFNKTEYANITNVVTVEKARKESAAASQ